MNDRKQLYTALALARLEIKPAAHDSTNEWHKYPYTSAESVIATCSPALAKHGLSLIPLTFEWHHLPSKTEYEAVKIESSWMLAHASGESMIIDREFYDQAEKGRPLAKILLGANTMVLSYLLRDLTGLPRPDAEDDISGRNDTGNRSAAKTPAQPPRTREAKPEPVPQASPVADIIIEVSPVTGAGWVRHDVRTGKGYRFSTFKQPDADMARGFAGTGEEVTIRWQKGKVGLDLVSVSRIGATAAMPTSPTTADRAQGIVDRLRSKAPAPAA